MFERPTRSYDGYIFDCDGTLADSMVVSHQAWLAAFRQHGATFDFGWELFFSRAGMTLPKTVEALNEQFGLSLDPAAVSAAQRAEYERFLPAVQPLAPVVELAREVARHARVSVASGGERAIVRRTLELIGLAETITIVITSEDVTRGKPEPDMFLLAAERMGVPASDCVVFEDSLFGLEAARRAGMDSVLVQPPSHGLLR
ncbi:MAG TPA: HAD family phosphatase [Polyangiaceae bacterium]